MDCLFCLFCLCVGGFVSCVIVCFVALCRCLVCSLLLHYWLIGSLCGGFFICRRCGC